VAGKYERENEAVSDFQDNSPTQTPGLPKGAPGLKQPDAIERMLPPGALRAMAYKFLDELRRKKTGKAIVTTWSREYGKSLTYAAVLIQALEEGLIKESDNVSTSLGYVSVRQWIDDTFDMFALEEHK